MSLRKGVAADVETDEKIGAEMVHRRVERFDRAVDTAVDVDEQDVLLEHAGHLGFSKRHSCCGLALLVGEPGKFMQRRYVSDFVQFARAGNRIVDVPFPRKTAERTLQAAEFKKARRSQRAHDITAAADANDEGAL